jgi:hypothetical protein
MADGSYAMSPTASQDVINDMQLLLSLFSRLDAVSRSAHRQGIFVVNMVLHFSAGTAIPFDIADSR